MSSLLSWDRADAASLFDRIRGEGRDASLERLVTNQVGASELAQADITRLIVSVKRHLESLLNTRPGSCRSAPELGVIDLNDATWERADLKVRIQAAIRHCIHSYEPRVIHVDVRSAEYQADPLEMIFQITAHIRLEQIEQVTSFNVQLDSQRHYSMV
ncbi:MAG: type VI secretion system baseplate subunit TssE [Aeromonadaceae bacterium]